MRLSRELQIHTGEATRNKLNKFNKRFKKFNKRFYHTPKYTKGTDQNTTDHMVLLNRFNNRLIMGVNKTIYEHY